MVEQKTEVWNPDAREPLYQPRIANVWTFFLCKRNKLISYVSHYYYERFYFIHLTLILTNIVNQLSLCSHTILTAYHILLG